MRATPLTVCKVGESRFRLHKKPYSYGFFYFPYSTLFPVSFINTLFFRDPCKKKSLQTPFQSSEDKPLKASVKEIHRYATNRTSVLISVKAPEENMQKFRLIMQATCYKTDSP